ncbi:MAG: DUF4878 domain-containing protein [Azoarcus sp.]|jgi:hypothetical protein|nr:DUF4878 domain-containing protein [Azoarcus sp.]
MDPAVSSRMTSGGYRVIQIFQRLQPNLSAVIYALKLPHEVPETRQRYKRVELFIMAAVRQTLGLQTIVFIYRGTLMSHFFAAGARKFLTLFGAVFAFTLLSACSSQGPEDVARDYIEAVADNRTEKAIEYLELGGIKGNDLTAIKTKMQAGLGLQHAAMKEKGGLKSVSPKLVKQEGDTADVEVELKYKNGETETENFTLTKKSGKWKVTPGKW